MAPIGKWLFFIQIRNCVFVSMCVQTLGKETLALYRNTLLRSAIERNLVTFPAQTPTFMKRRAGQIQQRAVQLYFVRGWTVRKICNRYGLTKKIVQDLLSDWRVRAISAGLIQEIETEGLYQLVLEHESNERDGYLPDCQWALNFSPTSHKTKNGAACATKLMTALKEDCLELGIELSRHQIHKIELIVRAGIRPVTNPPPNLPQTTGSGRNPGTSGFDSQMPAPIAERGT